MLRCLSFSADDDWLLIALLRNAIAVSESSYSASEVVRIKHVSVGTTIIQLLFDIMFPTIHVHGSVLPNVHPNFALLACFFPQLISIRICTIDTNGGEQVQPFPSLDVQSLQRLENTSDASNTSYS